MNESKAASTTPLAEAQSAFAGSFAHRERALPVLARGVSSSPRATQRPVPIVLASGRGARVTDVDGNRYIDYALGYGPLILGHSPQVVLDALQREMAAGLRSGSVHRGEVELAERIADLVPSAEASALVSSGTEACQLALRVARAATGRMQVIKFRNHYHGWSDAIHLANEPGRDGPTTAGQDPDAVRHVTVLDWDDVDGLGQRLREGAAAVIMEPAAVNAGCFAPPEGLLQQVRKLTAASGVVLIFDEVITGFRFALGGAQQRYGVTPDLTVLGKALGAGLPISGLTGSAEAMAPLTSGTVNLRGTYNGNPLCTAAAVACLDYLSAHAGDCYPRMDGYALAIGEHVRCEARRAGVALTANCVGPCVQLFAGAEAIPTLDDLPKVDRERTVDFTALLLRHGVATLPRGVMYLSTAHGDEEVAGTLRALTAAIDEFSRATSS